ncbi:hypothetical protein ACWEQL_35595 [Kitasatospora sp. NPDC004240]
MTTESVEPSPADAPPPAAVPPPAAAPVQPAPAAPPVQPPAAVPPPGQPVPVVPFPSGDVLAGGGEGDRYVPAAARVRRPRPVLLLACALVLGTLAGGAVGYRIQADRPETPLPPLQVALPSYPAEVIDPAVAAADAPKPLPVDGDLRKLVISAPAGSKPWDDYPDTPTWTSVGEFAERYGNSASVFRRLNSEGFRRAAEVNWEKDGVKFHVALVQFTTDHESGAKYRAKGGKEPFAPGVPGGYRVETEPDYWAETTEQYYYGFASARRGTVVMEVSAYGTSPVSAQVVKEIAKQQWERLV